jgi:hypothetical protein
MIDEFKAFEGREIILDMIKIIFLLSLCNYEAVIDACSCIDRYEQKSKKKSR